MIFQKTVLTAGLVWALVFAPSGTCGETTSPDTLTPRSVPSRILPVPDTVSPELQHAIGAVSQGPPFKEPQSAEEWKSLIAHWAGRPDMSKLRALYGVTVVSEVIAGVPCYIVTPREIPAKNRDRLLVNVHGGGYILGAGESGTLEAIEMAGLTHIKVIAIDYRMPPDHPFPAAMDDAMAVWKEIVRSTRPSRIAIFGTSTGGGMTLAMVQRAKMEGLPLPAAIMAGTPWSDLSKTGDSYFTNAGVDSVLDYDGVLRSAAKLYAHGQNLKDPRLSPVYGDFAGFPPTFLVTGTRDLFLSNTVRVHRKLMRAGAEVQLDVEEGQSHGQYLTDTPESRELYADMARFFDAHLDH